MLKRLQHIGQWPFLRAEALFNLAFGDRLNPLYYLGPIAYYMLWIAVVSGLYLYAFFKTGVDEAYTSVEYLTHAQWYLGGIMRSLHRYASDAMVLAMGLHMLRNFVFDRHRGFRWFSWISGVVLLWLVYAAGINGYMLPWDDLAQFTVIATAELFDRLPMFGGTLIRNFLFAEAVNDRLFSLLSFVHIGLPLAVLALLWIHTQRVPRAKTAPPMPIAATMTAALIILSLVKPALSGAQANLAAVAHTLNLDWFYMPVYALIYRWDAGTVWVLLGGATLFMLLLPWLPAKLTHGRVYHLMVRPDNRIIAVRSGETLLDAGLRDGVALPYECRNGGCGVCKGTLLYGNVDYGVHQESALTETEKRAGKALFCCATPLSDLEVEYVPLAGSETFKVRTYTAHVEKMVRLADDVMQLFLRPEHGEIIEFYAGQYINILLDDGDKRSFSFATAPDGGSLIELHVRWIPGGKFTTHVFTGMKAGDRVRFEGPLGSFFLREDSDKPILFVAGATGFAPVKSMVEYAFRRDLKRPMILYWGGRTRQGLYLADLAEQWAREHANFKFVPVLSAPAPADHWAGRSGLVHEAILQDFPDLSRHQVYACGSVQMVQAAHPAFIAHGMSEHDCFSDAFKLAPHARHSSPQADMVRLGGDA